MHATIFLSWEWRILDTGLTLSFIESFRSRTTVHIKTGSVRQSEACLAEHVCSSVACVTHQYFTQEAASLIQWYSETRTEFMCIFKLCSVFTPHWTIRHGRGQNVAGARTNGGPATTTGGQWAAAWWWQDGARSCARGERGPRQQQRGPARHGLMVR